MTANVTESGSTPPRTPPSRDAVSQRSTPPAPPREAPARPPTARPNTAPVLVKRTPPFSVRMSQFLWIVSFAVGGFAVVYFFVIREEQLQIGRAHV